MPKTYAEVTDFTFSQNQFVHIFDDSQFILFKNDRLPFLFCLKMIDCPLPDVIFIFWQ